ncbi:STAS domain-containing protein [Maridesulfovibrio sp.]|uniref:STAS domain-containing protein n=1 Tax=Maridesulfovibrio sp. TaxID=2795000 RepID=UPI002A1892E2|nr:STAS domain-containing protein [Maridesulfovibrio sp.]
MSVSDFTPGSSTGAVDGPSPIAFDFTEEDHEGYVMLAPCGGICNSTVKYMKNRLYDLSCEEGCKIVMSMKDVDFIDSVGLGTMITAHKNCDEYGGMIVYCSMKPMILKNMQLLNMDKFLKITPDLQSALNLLDW